MDDAGGDLRCGALLPAMDLSGVMRPVVVPVRSDPKGLDGPSPYEVRGCGWMRASHGFYVPTGTERTRDQEIVEAAVSLPDDWGGVTGNAALGWQGGVWFDGTPWGGGPVVLAIGGNRAIRPQATFESSEERLAPADLIVEDGLRITRAVRSVCFEMRYARNVRDAATTLAMACFNDLVSIEEVASHAATLKGWTGIPLCRDGISLAVENSWSPSEFGMLLVWQLDAGLAPPLCNAPVFDLDGKLIGTPDLIDPAAGVVGEYDGAVHRDRGQHMKDVVRADDFRHHGLEVVTMVAADNADPTAFVARLHGAFARAGDLPVSRRRWTLEQPSWWKDTSTVAARRGLSPYWRARLLRHRTQVPGPRRGTP